MPKLYSVEFSPTGSSQKLAEWISDVFTFEKVRVDLCRTQIPDVVMAKDDVCIFSMPCYGGRIPKPAAERLCHLHGDQTPAILCVTYGNRAYEDALLELAELAMNCGFSVLSACAVVTEHNILHVFGKGRPSPKDHEEIMDFALASAEKFSQGKRTKVVLPGDYPYREWGGIHLEIYIDAGSCVSCGTCAEDCPVAAVGKEHWQADKEKCIVCMRCIKRCPTQSRSLDGEVLKHIVEHLRPACENEKRNEFFL